MPELHPETQQKIGFFLSDVIALTGERLKRAIARTANPRAGSDAMADVDVMLVIDDMATREMYRIWDLAGDYCIKHEMIYSINPYSSADFEARMQLPAIAAFLAEGIEYDLQ